MNRSMAGTYVTFYTQSPVEPDRVTWPMDSWDVKTAGEMADNFAGQKPFGFKFTTLEFQQADQPMLTAKTSCMYYIHCRAEIIGDISVVTTAPDENGRKTTFPLGDGDVVL